MGPGEAAIHEKSRLPRRVQIRDGTGTRTGEKLTFSREKTPDFSEKRLSELSKGELRGEKRLAKEDDGKQGKDSSVQEEGKKNSYGEGGKGRLGGRCHTSKQVRSGPYNPY